MKTSELTLDYLADNVLEEDPSWGASVMLGQHVLRYMAQDSIAGRDRYYSIAGAHAILGGASEQPDVTGNAEVILHHGDGTWMVERSPLGSFAALQATPKQTAQYIGLRVEQEATGEALLQLALPLTNTSRNLLRNGKSVSYSFNSAQKGIMDRYDQNDLMFNPRRVQAAAAIMRHIVDQKITGRSSSWKTAEEEEAFLDKYFPYQDTGLTSGGGRTVRMRAMRPTRTATVKLPE